MPTQQATNDEPAAIDGSLLTTDEQQVHGDEEQVRDLALKQIERKRRFHARAFSGAAAAVVLVIIWAITEYNNAGGWPTDGFSQSSSIPHEWNSWIIYPIIAIALGITIDAWHTYRRRPVSESEIRREMDRLTRKR